MGAKCSMIEKQLKEHMSLEKYKDCTPEELLRTLPNIKPLDDGALLQEVGDGSYELKGMAWDALPKIDWYQLYNITGVRGMPLPADVQMPAKEPGLPDIYGTEHEV